MSQQQQEQQEHEQHRAVPIAWDPTCPARLCFLNQTSDSTSGGGNDGEVNDNNDNAFPVNDLYADTGAMSCNAYELAALYSILQSHQEYHHNLQSQKDGDENNVQQACQALSRACRAAVQTCVQDWEDSSLVQEREEEQEDDTNSNAMTENKERRAASMENLELLKSMLAIMHLSDVFLPLVSSSSSSGFGISAAGEADAFEIPGVVTADAVRFFRLHYMNYVPDLVATQVGCDQSAIQEMLESTQPEEYVVNDRNIYWLYVEALVKRGCLVQAWQTLKLHSLYRNAMAVVHGNDEQQQQDDDLMKKVLQGFGLLRLVLLRAPLPAGRMSEYDDALGTPDFFEDSDDIDDAEYNEEEDDDDRNLLMQVGLDLDPSDYKYWEVGTSSAVGGGAEDVPMMFSPQAAMRKHKTWQDFVQDLRPSFTLSRQVIPELDTYVLAILAGDFGKKNRRTRSAGGSSNSSNDVIQFTSWAERLIAELLYKRPNLSPRELQIVTRRAVLQSLTVNDNNDSQDELDDDARLKENAPMVEILLQIMQGHAAQAIEAMYSLGGGSGAALPVTLTSILYNLFLESSIMPPESAFRKTEFICEAASAIVSSLSGPSNKNNNNNVGAHLAIQFLLPYAYPNNDEEYGDDDPDVSSRRTEVMALMANIMEHYEPESESAARDLLDMCRPLLEATKSTVIMEPCASIVLCRYRKALRELEQQQSASSSNHASRAMEWLFQGMQLEVMVLNNGNRRDSSSTSVAMMMGCCHRTLLCWCLKTSLALLNAAANIIPVHPLTVQTAEEMVQTVRHATLSDNNVTPLKIIQVRQLVCIQELYDAFMEQGDLARAAEKIVDCLKDQVLSTDTGGAAGAGTVATLVPFSMYVPLLQIAQQILRQEEETHDWNTPNPTCAFDKYGVSVLMQTDTRVTALSTTSSSSTGTTQVAATGLKQREFSELLARALARAFVAENAKKKKSGKQQKQQQKYSQTDIASIRTVHLSEYPPDVQEAAVQRMLDL